MSVEDGSQGHQKGRQEEDGSDCRSHSSALLISLNPNLVGPQAVVVVGQHLKTISVAEIIVVVGVERRQAIPRLDCRTAVVVLSLLQVRRRPVFSGAFSDGKGQRQETNNNQQGALYSAPYSSVNVCGAGKIMVF